MTTDSHDDGNRLKLTNERLRQWLNADQASRERLCAGVLGLNRNYTDIRLRRPEGGPDGGRDIECLRGPIRCYGAVGFVNNASDTRAEKKQVRSKFASDLDSALSHNGELKAFVFFSNVDLTPGEVDGLQKAARAKGITSIDIYARERIVQALNTPEGLALRYQYLEIPLSEAEQVSFFSRFGSDIEALLEGRLDRLERRIDAIDFARWQAGEVHSLSLTLIFKNMESSWREEPEHFRACLEMQGVVFEKRSIFLGCEDDYFACPDGGWYFASKPFFFREQTEGLCKIEDSWIPVPVRAVGNVVTELQVGAKWRGRSGIHASEFEDLSLDLHLTQNLTSKIARVQFAIDSYLFLDSPLEDEGSERCCRPSRWPVELSKERAQEWRFYDVGSIRFDRLPPGRDWPDSEA